MMYVQFLGLKLCPCCLIFTCVIFLKIWSHIVRKLEPWSKTPRSWEYNILKLWVFWPTWNLNNFLDYLQSCLLGLPSFHLHYLENTWYNVYKMFTWFEILILQICPCCLGSYTSFNQMWKCLENHFIIL